LKAFVAQIGDELVLAQVLISRAGRRFELRHVADQSVSPNKLRAVPPHDCRPLAQFTAQGAFRPLKSAPNLQTGWRVVAANDAELEVALSQLYPGAIADWFAAQHTPPPITDYRAFANRQTGMYRITQRLDDAQAARAIRACCDRQFCLKRRLWSVTGLAPDKAPEKSLLQCLEPCAVLLEFARTAMRLEQKEKLDVPLAPEEITSLVGALESVLRHPDAGVREADFSAPDNARRLQLLLEKLRPLAGTSSEGEEE
jgi:hypothetical protein